MTAKRIVFPTEDTRRYHKPKPQALAYKDFFFNFDDVSKVWRGAGGTGCTHIVKTQRVQLQQREQSAAASVSSKSPFCRPGSFFHPKHSPLHAMRNTLQISLLYARTGMSGKASRPAVRIENVASESAPLLATETYESNGFRCPLNAH